MKLGKLLDFDVVVIDHAPTLSTEPDMLIDEPNYDLSKFDFRRSDSVIVLTKGTRDVDILRKLSDVNVRFVGLLASRKRVAEDLRLLREQGVREEFISSLHAPVGIDIGAITPMEIALSIMADVITVKHGKHGPHKTLQGEMLGKTVAVESKASS